MVLSQGSVVNEVDFQIVENLVVLKVWAHTDREITVKAPFGREAVDVITFSPEVPP